MLDDRCSDGDLHRLEEEMEQQAGEREARAAGEREQEEVRRGQGGRRGGAEGRGDGGEVRAGATGVRECEGGGAGRRRGMLT